MNLKLFVMNYARHRGFGLSECEAFDAAMTAPQPKNIESRAAVRVPAAQSQPQVDRDGQTAAAPDVVNRPISPAGNRSQKGDGRGRFYLVTRQEVV